MKNEMMNEKLAAERVPSSRCYSRVRSPLFDSPSLDVTVGKVKKRNWQQTIKVTLLLVTPMIILMGMTINAHVEAVDSQKDVNAVKQSIKASLEVAELVRMLQIERGRTSMYLSTDRTNEHVYSQLEGNRADTTEKFLLVSDWSFVDIPQLANSTPDNRAESFSKYMSDFRKSADSGGVTVTESLQFFSELNADLIGTLFRDAKATSIYKSLVAFDNFARSGEAAGIQRAIGAAFWIPCDYIQSNRLWLIRTHSVHIKMRDNAFRYFPPLGDEYYRIRRENRPLWQDIEKMVSYLISGDFKTNCSTMNEATRLQTGQDWFNNMTKYINLLSVAREVLMTNMERGLDLFVEDAQTKIDIERQRADQLLSQMLPPSVVESLKRDVTPGPEFFHEITVYFSDIVGFAHISAMSTPHDIIDLLNMIYDLFDETLEKYDVYKVETIGDAYMVASGVPIKNERRHVVEICRLSLELLRLMSGMIVPHLPEETIQLRIGINSGPCAAGVVGQKMPRYCLFGDTINTASRMQSNGQANKIHVSMNTRNLLLREKEFILTEKGETFIKGKGMMTTYWLSVDKEQNNGFK